MSQQAADVQAADSIGGAIAFLQLADLAVPIAIRVALGLGIADCIGDDGATVGELADRLRVSREPFERLMRLLACAGLVREVSPGLIVLTDVGGVAKRDHPLALQAAFALAETDLHAWLELEFSVKTGSSGFERAFGESHRSYRTSHPEEDVRMDRAHQTATRLETVTLARAYPWKQIGLLVDVGGGTGMFLAELLGRFKSIRGVLFDLPRMVARASTILAAFQAEGRCRAVGGDFFCQDQIPKGGDAYVLKAVLGGWDDAAALTILKNLREAMSKRARAIIIEPMQSEGRPHARGNVIQLHSLVLYGGRLRSAKDYVNLANAADLEVVTMSPRDTLSLIVLKRAGEPM